MDPTQFDRVAKLFAIRKSRRGALAGGAAGMAALAGASRFGAVTAQEATPAASPAAGVDISKEYVKPEYLFVQTFAQGAVKANTGGDSEITVTLSGVAGQTVYFADRPARDVGITQNQAFFDGLGFSADNPPNAAIVAELDSGEQDVLAIELLNPVYDADAATLTYGANVLEGFADSGFSSLSLISNDQNLPASFGAGSLFIDDCDDGSGTCLVNGSQDAVGTIDVGCCWGGWKDPSCSICDDPAGARYGLDCSEAYPDYCTYTTDTNNPNIIAAWDCSLIDYSCPGVLG